MKVTVNLTLSAAFFVKDDLGGSMQSRFTRVNVVASHRPLQLHTIAESPAGKFRKGEGEAPASVDAAERYMHGGQLLAVLTYSAAMQNRQRGSCPLIFLKRAGGL